MRKIESNHLHKVLKNLIKETEKEFFSKLDQDKISEIVGDVKEARFENSKWLTSYVKNSNYKKIVYENRKKISALSSCKIVKIVLEKIIREKHEAHEAKIVIDISKFIQDLILDFLAYYENQLFINSLEKKSTDNSIKKLEKFLNDELFDPYCFITLRNFECDPELNLKSKNILFHNDVSLQFIKPREFAKIANIDESSKIHPNFLKTKYVISTHIPRTSLNMEKVRCKLEMFQSALKIFGNGDIKFGGIYYSDSENWEIKSIHQIKFEPIQYIPRRKYKLQLNNKSKTKFTNFYNHLSKINFTKDKYVFLGRSINRFSKAKENEEESEQLVDFITCLESLYSTKEQQLSYRFAMRVAMVLGQTSEQKTLLQKFILQTYDLRSKIVHGDELPDIELNKKIIDLRNVNEKLEKISRDSIKVFLTLIENVENKEEIHNEIDKSIFDPIIQNKFSGIVKRLDLIPTSFD